MAWRVIIRFSLNNDAGSRVRNTVAPLLLAAGINNTATGTWEAAAGNPADVASAIDRAVNVFASAAAPAELDHLWIYVDKAP